MRVRSHLVFKPSPIRIKIETKNGTEVFTGKEIFDAVMSGIVAAGILLVAMYTPDIFR